MRKTRTGIPRLFVLLSLALLGLTMLQVILLRDAWSHKEQALRSGAQSALASAVLKLQSREIEGSAYEYFFADNDTNITARIVTRGVSPAPEALRLHRFQQAQSGLRRLGGDVTIEHVHDHTWNHTIDLATDSLVVVIAPEDAPQVRSYAVRVPPRADLRDVVGNWISQPPQPIRERLDQAQIADVLAAELAAAGIGAEPAFGVMRPAESNHFVSFPGSVHGTVDALEDEVVLASDNITEAELRDSALRHELFPLDPFGAPYELVLAFPGDRLYLARQIGPLWLASVLFMSMIVIAFARAWRTNAEQRRFGGQLVDFINNMTHEFKTPIATVSLAGEAMARPDVQADPQVLDRYVGMIRDENARMHRQVEKILQMARFEQGDIELNREAVDVHEVLQDVTASFALQVERRGGELGCRPAAARSVVSGDPVHLASIFANLVDNAVKYATEAPQVTVTTADQGAWLEVRVTDQGPGIPREEQRRVFEKYYRRPTGDRHDVKGFGLGLSFVRSLVRAHGGHVDLHSEPGRGTTVAVSLPLATTQPEGSA